MFAVKGDGNSPGKSGPGDTKILQTGTEKIIDHLISSRYRLNELRVGFNMFQETVGIFRETKKITLFVYDLNFPAAVRTSALHQLPFQPKGLTGGTVPTLVFALVDIPLLMEAAENLLDPFDVPFLRSSDKIIITNL